MNILVTGGNGQLAKCIKDLERQLSGFTFIYKNSSELNITNKAEIEAAFLIEKYKYCINCAAYTAVDKAEEDSENAYNVNAYGSENLAKVCLNNNTTLIHISTDFVFNGNSDKPYTEESKTMPLGVYGSSKFDGEQKIENVLDRYFIVRTSWLYSEHGNNFLKTMLRLANDRDELSVVNDQIGSPTYAKDLASAILNIIKNNCTKYGLYHYSNKGVISWYDFAKEIFRQSNIDIVLHRIRTEQYPTAAKRPKFSVLNSSKIQDALDLDIPNWKDSLSIAISNLNSNLA